MLVRPEIRRGSDAGFKIYLRDQDGRPYDLTGVTALRLRLPKDPIGAVEVTSAETPAVAATASLEQDEEAYEFTAETAGLAGNDIELEFDGSTSVQDVVDAWNTANPGNSVSFDGDGDTLLDPQTVALAGGVDAYTKLVAQTPLQLGTVNVLLSEADTALLKIGKNIAIELTIDKGASPGGQRKVVLLRDALSVEEKFF
jgi:hypothetical protein